MFNDRFNLTKLVLEGIKTHTRRLELDCNIRFYLYNYEGSYPKIEEIRFVFIPMTVISLSLEILGIKSEKKLP